MTVVTMVMRQVHIVVVADCGIDANTGTDIFGKSDIFKISGYFENIRIFSNRTNFGPDFDIFANYDKTGEFKWDLWSIYRSLFLTRVAPIERSRCPLSIYATLVKNGDLLMAQTIRFWPSIFWCE